MTCALPRVADSLQERINRIEAEDKKDGKQSVERQEGADC